MPMPLLSKDAIPRERFDRALELATEGKPLKTVIEALGISRQGYLALCARDALFEKAITRARIAGFDTIADTVLTMVDEEEKITDPQLLKLKADNTKWYLQVMNPAKYAQRNTVTIESVDIGSALTEAKQRTLRIIESSPLSLNPPDPFE